MYKDLIRCKNRWSYYDNPPYLSYNTLFIENDSFEFIKEYFSCGGKEKLFEDEYIDRESDIIKKRAPHIVSTFLLGIIIAESFGLDLCKNDDNAMNLKYLWFLSCFYHDIGYIYEENPCCKQLRKIQTKGLAALKNICDIKYYEKDEFRTYNERNIDLYLSYRAKCSNGKMGVIDHGIAGGLMLYDRLRKNYEQAWEKASTTDKNLTKNSFNYNSLYFSTKHFQYYAKAADAIISHNIWLDTLKKCLEKKGKEYKENSKIKANNKVAFILALADTIEPIKRYGFFALNEISYEKIENGFAMLMPNIDDNNAYKYLIDLQNWVDVSVDRDGNNTFFIQRSE